MVLLLGVRVDNKNKNDALALAGEFLAGEEQKKIFTPNPEMLVKADKDLYFKQVLNTGDLNLCDGIGLKLAACWRGEKLTRLPGVDFVLELCALTQKLKKTVYLIGGEEKIAREAAQNLEKQFLDLKITGYAGGPRLKEECNGSLSGEDGANFVQQINFARPDILLVAYGMGKQEKWIVENLSKMPSVKIAMGVGGTFDYLSNRVRRAPRVMRSLGLEWLFRLWQQPQRFFRIIKATLVFCALVLKNNK